MRDINYPYYFANNNIAVKPRIAGLFLMPLRWVSAWILFAAAWRRLVLKPEALNPHSPEYEGIKLNHFLPHTDLLATSLNYIILHPPQLQTFLWAFTLLEAVIGIFLFVGFCSRLVGIILIAIFTNLMLVAGWLGTTCLDEWTVATFGIAFGICLFLAGSGPISLDALLYTHLPRLAKNKLFSWSFSPELAFIREYRLAKRYSVMLSAVILAFVLYTNQHFVGGVYGPFHNPAIKPNLNISAILQQSGNLDLNIYRNQGPDTYGSFIVAIKVVDAKEKTVLNFDAKKLGQLPDKQIDNTYLTQVKANGYSLVVPLGAKAQIHLSPLKPLHLTPGEYTIFVNDVSGLSWQVLTQLV